MAFAGLIVTVGFLALFLPLTGFAAFVVPAIGNLVEQGQMEMISVLDAVFKEPFLPIQFFAGILWNIGSILLGIAIWRSETLWKWGGLLLSSNEVFFNGSFYWNNHSTSGDRGIRLLDHASLEIEKRFPEMDRRDHRERCKNLIQAVVKRVVRKALEIC